ELSNETYKAVILTAERFNHDLTLQFGCLARDCEDEVKYLAAAESLIKYLLTDENIDNDMDDIFFGNPPDKQSFYKTLNKILANIEKVRKIPMENRKFEF
ncbi:MAG: hypothetical protein LBT27_00985, partial [Prevotellaceae bacterium]|nr:hypothetical protein [Prevotellaceae bacterium]